MLSLQALSDPYFYGLANKDNEPSKQPISKLEFDFEKRKLTKDDVRELIYREVCLTTVNDTLGKLVFASCLSVNSYHLLIQILEYHPKMLHDYLEGSDNIGFMYPRSAFITRFKCVGDASAIYMLMIVWLHS